MIDPELLLQGYRLGVFPMAMEDDSIQWFSPDPRAILPLEDFHVPHALRRLVRKKVFATTINNAFSKVIEACAKREDTWINLEIIESYMRLHQLGYAHSVEAWKQGKLAGGLYGVAVGGVFFGESMFHHVTNASKIALVALVEHLRARKFALLDTQWLTPHLQQFGGIEISRDFDTAKLLQVWSEPLGVKQGKLSSAQMLYQGHQRDFRGIRHVVEHRFAKKNATDGNAVESTSELALLPGFDGMCVTELMQSHVAFNNFEIDPRILAFRARLDDFRKRVIYRRCKNFFAHETPQRVWHMKIFQGQNCARIGRKPLDRVVLHRHGKNAEPITLQQEFGIDHGGRSENVKRLQRKGMNRFNYLTF